jgi:hypothetical protein
MTGRRRSGLALVLLVVIAGFVWRAAHGRASESDRAVDATLAALARQGSTTIAVLAGNDDVGRVARAAMRNPNAPRITVVPRDPLRIAAAASRGALLADPRGVEYLEALGYELVWLPGASQSGFAWARVERRLRCASVTGKAWSPLPGLEYTGRLGIVLPAAARGALLLIVGDHIPLDVEVSAVDGTPVRMSREEFHSIAATPPDYWIESGSPLDAPSHVQQLTLFAQADADRVLGARLGRRAPRVLARLRDYPNSASAMVCASPVGTEAAFREGAAVFIARPDARQHFGTGWSDVLVAPGVGPVRWMRRDAALLVSFAERADVRVTLRAHRRHDAGDGQLSIRVNDLFDGRAHTLMAGTHDYRWSVPASAWVSGTNEVLLRVSGAGVDRLLAVARLELTLDR